ncbi:unnamed protein product [Sphagnum jensenii]|uniref:Uncharacterized protein n=1 Tax=Sphagnum jensenii TaxID=128206 RepID=A0ABP1AXF4_9BRYO
MRSGGGEYEEDSDKPGLVQSVLLRWLFGNGAAASAFVFLQDPEERLKKKKKKKKKKRNNSVGSRGLCLTLLVPKHGDHFESIHHRSQRSSQSRRIEPTTGSSEVEEAVRRSRNENPSKIKRFSGEGG